MKKITMLCLAAGLAFVGCSAPKAVELDSGANITLNHNLIQKRHFGIQKDEFLRYNNWVYNKAKIEIQEMDFLNKNKVNILFFHKKEEKENI